MANNELERFSGLNRSQTCRTVHIIGLFYDTTNHYKYFWGFLGIDKNNLHYIHLTEKLF